MGQLSYEWNQGLGDVEINEPGNREYALTVTDENGCLGVRHHRGAGQPASGVVGSTDANITRGNSSNFSPFLGRSSFYTYQWSNGGVSTL